MSEGAAVTAQVLVGAGREVAESGEPFAGVRSPAVEDRRFLIPMLAALGVLVVAMAVMGVSDAGWVRWLAVASFGAFFVFWLTTRYGRAWLLVIAVVIAAAFVAQRLLG